MIGNADEADLVVGMTVVGTVEWISHDEVLLDIGRTKVGVIPRHGLAAPNGIDALRLVSEGQRIEAVVVADDDGPGRVLLSHVQLQRNRAELDRLLSEETWSALEEAMVDGDVVDGRVTEVLAGGLVLDIGVRGFLPANEVERHPSGRLAGYLGAHLHAKVVAVDRAGNAATLSRRALLEEIDRDAPDDPLPNLTAPADGGPRLVFLSHASEDHQYVDRLDAALRSRDFEPWQARSIRDGARWIGEIENAMRASFAMIVVVTPEARASPWVEDEVIFARHLGLPIFPLWLRGEPWWIAGSSNRIDVRNGALPGDRFFASLRSAAGGDEMPPLVPTSSAGLANPSRPRVHELAMDPSPMRRPPAPIPNTSPGSSTTRRSGSTSWPRSSA